MAVKTKQIECQIGTGRCKSAVARIRLTPGTGKIVVNQRPMEKYFVLETNRNLVRHPLTVTSCDKSVDLNVQVSGGGINGQAGAVSLAVARALLKYATDKEPLLREGKFLTVDSRRKERKKYGRRGARRGFQFSKR